MVYPLIKKMKIKMQMVWFKLITFQRMKMVRTCFRILSLWKNKKWSSFKYFFNKILWNKMKKVEYKIQKRYYLILKMINFKINWGMDNCHWRVQYSKFMKVVLEVKLIQKFSWCKLICTAWINIKFWKILQIMIILSKVLC